MSLLNSGCFFLCAMPFLLLAAHAAQNPEPDVVPAIQQWTGAEGAFDAKSSSILVDTHFEAQLSATAGMFHDELQAMGLGQHIVGRADAPQAGQFFLTLDGANPKAAPARLEGYTLEIADAVVLRANSPAGMIPGTRTLLQLLAQNKNAGVLPKGVAIDFPEYAHRMLMIDVARRTFTVAEVKDYLRIMSWYKMNELHIHLSDDSGSYSGFRVESKKFPGLASKDLAYSWQDLRDIQDFARARGITVTPEIDMPGHAGSLTKYWPELRHPLLSKSYLDVTNPKTAERMKELLGEIIPLFDAPDFHIGTDEYALGGLPAAEREKVGEAFRQFINTMNEFIRSKGKNCRIWSGFEHMPGKTLPDPSVVIDMWVTRDAKSLIERGHNVINSSDGSTYIVPGAHYYGVSNIGTYTSWEPNKISGDASKNPDKADPHLLGGKLHIWNDQGPSGYTSTEIADISLDSIIAFSEKLWGRKGSPDYATFQKRAAKTKPVPGVTIFERLPAKDESGLVFAADGEKTLESPASIVPLLAESSRGNLEYPWTLSMSVMKTADTGKRGVIVSSDLVEICSDLSVSETVTVKDAAGKPVKQKVTRKGVGLVRAAGSFGKDPTESSYWHDVSGVYADPLPLNTWVNVSIVATQRQTALYVNGKLAGKQGNQMVCPLIRLGSATGNSFVGHVKDLKVFNHALNAKDIARAAGLEVLENLAENCAVTASRSDTEHGFVPANATDGSSGTRWSSGPGGAPTWLAIDLGKTQTVARVTITWENAFAKTYSIEVSEDGAKWTQVFKGEGQGGETTATFPPASARHVRIVCTEAANGWGYSIWEAEVYGPSSSPAK